MKEPILITFDGLKAVGKSTQIDLLKGRLNMPYTVAHDETVLAARI